MRGKAGEGSSVWVGQIMISCQDQIEVMIYLPCHLQPLFNLIASRVSKWSMLVGFSKRGKPCFGCCESS